MRCVGIDLSKSAFAALALAVNNQPARAFTWVADGKKDSEPMRLESFFNFVEAKLWLCKPDIVVVERIMGLPNRQVVQILSRFEGVALLAGRRYARRQGCIVINVPVSQSRSAALGIPGNAKKEVAWETIKKMYPDFKFGRADQGGMDKGDAMTHALAGPTVLERG